MIEIIPAIDLMDGQCVRLSQGKYNEKIVYSNDPVQIAKTFENNGFKRLHLVDLDGAKIENPVNLKILEKICSSTNILIDYSGGIRTDDQVQHVLDTGSKYVGIGSLAVKEPAKFKQMIKKFGADKFILAADVLNNEVYINGWLNASGIKIYDLISEYSEVGINKFMCTDISRDGMLSGVDLELYSKLKLKFNDKYVIASGGVSSNKDISDLEKRGIDAVIVGKAFYENLINIENLTIGSC